MPPDEDLVGQAPHSNAGVVVILEDQLFHLGQGVGTAVFHVHGDVGDLCPDDKALFVAQVIEMLCVLIVGQPDGVGPDLQNEAMSSSIISLVRAMPASLRS